MVFANLLGGQSTSASGGDYVPFFEYAIQGFLDGLTEQIAEIRKFQLDVIWRNYVHEAFGDRKTGVEKRRRDVVLALSYIDKPVRLAGIASLSPGLAAAYHGASKMLLNRDLNAIGKMGLIVRSRHGVIANKRIVEAFLPFRIEKPASNSVGGES